MNDKGADQTARKRRLVYTYVVRNPQKTGVAAQMRNVIPNYRIRRRATFFKDTQVANDSHVCVCVGGGGCARTCVCGLIMTG